MEVRAGEVHFARGGAEHACATQNLPITIKSGAKVAGNVTFTHYSPVMVESGATLRNGMPGVNNSRIVVHTVTFWEGAILEVDLANTSPIMVPQAVTGENPVDAGTVNFEGTLTVRLTNLPTTAPTAPKKLTNFLVAPSGSPTIVCAEAAALNATVRFGYEENGAVEDPNNLYLVPTDGAYLWEGKTGNWSATTTGADGNVVDPAWRLQENLVSFPTSGTDIVARVSGNSDLTLDKKPGFTDGAAWQTQMLIFAAEANESISLLQGATLPTDLTQITSYLLNRPAVSNTLWKLGNGDVTIETPIAFSPSNARANFGGGRFIIKHPFIVTELPNGVVAGDNVANDYAIVPTAMELSDGATLRFALTADEATIETAKKVLPQAGANEPIGYNPLKQTLSGNLTGTGTIEVDGADSQLILSGATDNDIDYIVTQGTLTLAGDLPVLARQTPRSITLEKETTLELKTAGAAGYSTALTWSLVAADTDTSALEARETGTKVTTENEARIRGTVNVAVAQGSTAPKAFLGTSRGSVDGNLTLEVPAGASLLFGGEWTTPADTTSGQILKAGAGELTVTGRYRSNLPMTIASGVVRFVTGSAVEILDNNKSATRADWVVNSGAILSFENSGKVDLGAGTLQIASGAILNVACPTLELGAGTGDATGITFANASVIAMTAGTPSTVSLLRPTMVEGTVIVDLDTIAADLIAGTETKYTLIRFENGAATRRGSGIFQLGGAEMVNLAKAGWSLYDEGVTVELRRLGEGTTYTWAGTDGNWTSTTPSWYPPTETTKKTWAEIVVDPALRPAVLFQDYDDRVVPTQPVASTTVNWTAGEQMLGALRCDNSDFDYTLTATKAPEVAAEDFDADLTIVGDLLKTGKAKLTIERPLVLNRETGLLKVLGGELELRGTLTATSGTFERPVTVTDGATLRFGGMESRTLLGRIEGDGHGTIAHSGTATLTLGSTLDNLAALNVESGSVRLTAKDHTLVYPTVTVADGAQLVYAGSFSTVADVMMNINGGATPTGTLVWEASASVNTTQAPSFAAPAGAPAAMLNVKTFRYNPQAGHLVLNPGTDIFPETTALELNADKTVESLALLLGADTANGTTLTFSGLGGSGGLIGAEPTIGTTAYDWSTKRVLTLRLAEDNTFAGAFMGAWTADNVRITTGLAVEKDPAAQTNPTFTYTGASTNADLGTLSVGADTRVEVTGTWAGDVAVVAAGELAGSGTLGAQGRTTTIPAGARLTASAMGKRETAANVYTDEVIPTELTVHGNLALEADAEMTVLVRKTLANDAPWVSCVTTDTLALPDTTVSIKVILDRDDLNYVVSNIPILKWTNRTGSTRLDGTVYYREADGSLTPTNDYYLRQETGMLKLMRTGARFWMILR